MSDDEQAGNDELLVLRSSWPVSTIGCEPSITTGTLVVWRMAEGEFGLSVSSGDELHPDNLEVQFPLSREHADLVRRALDGEQVGHAQ